jgi:hypothetical protein
MSIQVFHETANKIFKKIIKKLKIERKERNLTQVENEVSKNEDPDAAADTRAV